MCQLYNNVVRSSCYANSAARVEENERGVHYVFNPGCYFRMINAKYNIHIIINTECSLCIATDILYNNYKYNTECFMHLLNDTVFLHIYRNNKRTLSL